MDKRKSISVSRRQLQRRVKQAMKVYKEAKAIGDTSSHSYSTSSFATIHCPIKADVENNSILLNELPKAKRKISVEKPPSNLPMFPLKDAEALVEFDNRLLSDGTTYDYMVRRLAAIGGSNMHGTTQRILRYLLADEVAILYNWKGRDKLSFEKTRLMAAIFDGAKLNYPTEGKNDHIIANAVKDWLKFAKSRLTKKRQRPDA